MKKFYALLIILFSSTYGWGQISINSADLPQPGDTFRVSSGIAFTGMDPTLTGAGYTWDYSQLTSLNQSVDTFLSVNSTNPLYSIIFVNIAFNTNRCNLANLGQSFTLGAAAVNNVYNFYYNASAAYTQKGFGASVNGVPLPVIYSPFDVIYNFPLNYNNSDSSASSYHVDLTSTLGVYYKVNRMRHNLVDGWGSLTTPYGTFDALRVKSTIIEQDSVYLDTVLHIGFNLPPVTTIEYKWLGLGKGIPLLQINTSGSGAVNSITYRDSLRLPDGIAGPITDAESIRVFPNPASEELFVTYLLTHPGQADIELYSMTGQQVYATHAAVQEAGRHEEKIQLKKLGLAKGTYLMRSSLNGIPGLKQVVIWNE